jgi:DNA-binding MurR/RpiR family transcriptional regulator
MEDLKTAVLPFIRSFYPTLFSAEKKVADFILNNSSETVRLSVSELAEKSGVSDATIVRFAQKLGFKGFYQMKIILAREIGALFNPLLEEKSNDNDSGFHEIFRSIITNLQETERFTDFFKIKKCAEMISKCENLYFIAAGNTISTALDANYRFTRIGIKSITQTIPEVMCCSLSLVTEKDVVIGISHSGSSKLVVDGLNLAKEHNAFTISITNHIKSPVSGAADENIFISSNDQNYIEYFSVSKICETAVIDLLLYSVSQLRRQDTYKKIESLESLLASYKF